MFMIDSVKKERKFLIKTRDTGYTSIGDYEPCYKEEQICIEESFSQRLKYLREYNGDSQTDLSYILIVSRQTIGSYETGRTEPCLDVLRRISMYYNISVDCLICNNRCNSSNATKLSS